MIKILEVVVVEGAHDTQKLQSFFEVDTIETQGTHLSKDTLLLIEQLQKTRGVIIFTDPDAPGEKIRALINQHVAGCKNAFVFKEDAKTSKKVGIEHATKQTLEKALSNLVTYTTQKESSLSLHEFNKLGLNGDKDSAKKRLMIAKRYHIGKCNAKTLYKRLNMLGISQQELIEFLTIKR